MTGLEISLIIIGVIIFIGSFFFTEKLSSSDIELIHKLSEKEVKNVVDEKIAEAKVGLEEYFTERSEEAISHIDALTGETANRQLLSIGEYSDTVLDAMQKTQNENHFIYERLNDKQDELAKLADMIEDKQAELRAMDQSIQERTKELADLNVIIEEKEQEYLEDNEEIIRGDVESIKEAFTQKLSEGVAEQNKGRSEMDQKAVNDKIIELHEKGASDIEIAKQLGKGLGEVKLVLGLFE
ncbi:MAG: hypothetical protein K6B14_04305 [Lachnospiraceae bacterium]|nr:hypothetical protein [Lachnospiraceae bacterium]